MAVEDVDLTPTAEMRDLAARGLDYHEQGMSGDGLAESTVSEARAIADGEAVSPDKVVRMNAWFARHLPDLEAPANSDPDNEDFPGPGAVAWFLWAGDPTDAEAGGVSWSSRKVEELDAEGYRSEGEGAPYSDDDMTDESFTPAETTDAERSHARGGCEWRESGAGKQYRVIRGYAAVFNSRSEDLGGFIEVLEPGAFEDALRAEPDVSLLYNHDDATVMARTTAGNLEVEEDDRGLRVWARVDMADPDVARMVGKMNAGVVSQMSFRFTLNPGGDEWDTSNGTPIRIIKRGGIKRLYEVTVTPFPAYPESKAAVFERAVELGRLPVEAGAEEDAAPAEPVDDSTPEPRADGAGEDRRAENARLRAALWAARLSKHRNRSVQK